MKSLLLTLYVSFLSINGNTQIVLSDCSAHDTILDQYRKDAASLTLQKFIDTNSPYNDSIIIPTTYSDSILNALIAVYNLTNCAERDTVTDILNIHVYENVSLTEFILSADSTLPWMQNLSLGNLVSGQPILDQMMADYNISLLYYSPSSWQPTAYVNFIADEYINLIPVTDTLATIPGVISAMPNYSYGDASTIYSETYPTHIELTYRYGWGDCPAGCLNERRWKFNVYYDCSVEFMGSSGDALPILSVCPEKKFEHVLVFPNPFTDYIKIGGTSENLTYQIIDGNGRQILSGESPNRSINLGALGAGVYQLVLNSSEGTKIERIVKL